MIISKVGNSVNNITQYRAIGNIFGKQDILPREVVFWSDEKFTVGQNVTEDLFYLTENEYGSDLSTVAIAFDDTVVIDEIFQKMIEANDEKRNDIESEFQLETEFDSIIVFDTSYGKSLILVNSLYAEIPEDKITQLSINTQDGDDLSLVEMIYFYIMNTKEESEYMPSVEGIFINGEELDHTDSDHVAILRTVFDLLIHKINTFDIEEHLIDTGYDEKFLDI